MELVLAHTQRALNLILSELSDTVIDYSRLSAVSPSRIGAEDLGSTLHVALIAGLNARQTNSIAYVQPSGSVVGLA